MPPSESTTPPGYHLLQGGSLEQLLRYAHPLLPQDLFAPSLLLVSAEAQLAQRCRRYLVQQLGCLFALPDLRPATLTELLHFPAPSLPLLQNQQQLVHALWALLEQEQPLDSKPWLWQPLQKFLAVGAARAPIWRLQLAQLIAKVFSDYLAEQAPHLSGWEKEQLSLAPGQPLLTQLPQAPLDSAVQDECWQLCLWQQLWRHFSHPLHLLQQGEIPALPLPTLLLVGSADLLNPQQYALIAQLRRYTCVVHLLLEGPLAEESSLPAQEIIASWQASRKRWIPLYRQLDQTHKQLEAEARPPSLLGQLQCLLEGKASHLQLASTLQLMAGDDSLHYHACAGNWRQVEILHDQLLHWFAQHPHCPAHEVAVLAPNIDDFAPFIAHVFNCAPQVRLPFQLVGHTLGQEAPLLQAFLALLKLADEKFFLPAVVPLLENPCFAPQLGGVEERKGWVQLCQQLAIHYGYSPADLAPEQLPLDNSWRSGWQRLIAALVSETGQDALEVQGLSSRNVAEFVSLMEELYSSLSADPRERSLAQWGSWAEQLIQQFLRPRKDFPGDLQQVQKLNRLCRSYQQQQPLEPGKQPLALFAHLLQQSLAENQRQSATPLWSKGVLCSSIHAAHGLHFRAIFVLGLDDDVFPHLYTAPSFALTDSSIPMLASQNHQFLHLIFAAEQKLSLFYNGQDPCSGQQKAPSLLVRQLWQLLDKLTGQEDFHKTLQQHHPLHAFSPRYFSTKSKLFSYNRQAEAYAQTRARRKSHKTLPTPATEEKKPAAQPASAPPSVPPGKGIKTLDLWQLQGLLTQHPLVFWKQLAPPKSSKKIPETIGVFELAKSSQQQLLQNLVQQWWQRQPLAACDTLLAQMRRQGRCPELASNAQAQQQFSQNYHDLVSILAQLPAPGGERGDLQLCPESKRGAQLQQHPFIRPAVQLTGPSGELELTGVLSACAYQYQLGQLHLSRYYYRLPEWKNSRYDGLLDSIILLSVFPQALVHEYVISPQEAYRLSYSCPENSLETSTTSTTSSNSQADEKAEEVPFHLPQASLRLAELVQLYLYSTQTPWPLEKNTALPPYHDWPKLSLYLSSLQPLPSTLGSNLQPSSPPLDSSFQMLLQLCAHRKAFNLESRLLHRSTIPTQNYL